jgi:hypothetical protein
MWWRGWLRHFATSRKIAGSFPDGVIAIFYWHNPTFLGSTQPEMEMNTTDIFCIVKAPSASGWQPHQLHVPIVLKSGSLNHLELPVSSLQALSPFILSHISLRHSAPHFIVPEQHNNICLTPFYASMWPCIVTNFFWRDNVFGFDLIRGVWLWKLTSQRYRK